VQKVFVPSQVVHPLHSHLEANQLIAEVFTIDDVISELKKFRVTKNEAKLKVIITSSCESRVSIKTLLVILYLAWISCDVLCVRSPREWFYSTRRKMPVPQLSKGVLVKLRVYFLDLACFFAERLLFTRTRKITFEHQSMMEFFLNKSKYLAKRKPNLVFSGRFQVPGYKLSQKTTSKTKWRTDPKFIGIGILGTLNPERRDYRQLEIALESLEKQGYRPLLYFLGGYIGNDSEKIIQLFSKFLGFAPNKENSYVLDTQILLMKSEIDILIAPLSQDWGYSQGKSSGSIADAIYLNKPLILPSSAKLIFNYDWISYYSTVDELHDLISMFHSLPLPVAGLSEGELAEFLRT
jgi:hypothetical protein